jgi:hypothetical protein
MLGVILSAFEEWQALVRTDGGKIRLRQNYFLNNK